MKKSTLFFLMLTVYVHLFSQTGNISGKVIDKHTNEALAGATIAIKGRSASTITDNLGNFKLLKVDTGDLVLVISYVGYDDVELPVNIVNGDRRTVNAILSLTDRIGNTVVVSASKRPEKITNAPASIQIIGVKQLNQFAGFNVGELVSKVQGIEYTRNGISDITFNARGFHSAFNNKVLLMVDGRNSMAALSGGLAIMNRGSTSKDDLERMEIVLGPQTALHGPNALNAIFNLMTKDPRKFQGTTVAVTAGNHYVTSGRFRQAAKINEKWAYKISGEYSGGNEYNFYDSVYVTKFPGYDSSIPEHTLDRDFRHIKGEAHIYYSVTPKTDIIVSAGGSNNNYVQVTTAGRNQMRGITYSFLQARLVNQHYYVNLYNTRGNIGTSYPIGAYTRIFWNLTHKPNPLTPEKAEDSALRATQFKEESQRLNADAQYNYDFKKAGVFFVVGLNYQKERPNGFGRNLLDSFQRINVIQYGAVVQLEKSLPWSFRFVGAVRWNNHSNFGNFYSPKLGLVKTVGDGSFRLTWGKAYAMPTILNQYSYLSKSSIGNGEGISYVPNGTVYADPKSLRMIKPLKPEEVSTWEFGYKGAIAKKLYVDINYYNGFSKNFLGTSKSIDGSILYAGSRRVWSSNPGRIDPVTGVLTGASFSTYFNYSAVRNYGLDAGLTYLFNKFISLRVNYSWFDSDITDDDMKNDANGDGYVSLEETSLNAPNHRGLIDLNLQNLFKQRVFVTVSARIVQQYDFYSVLQIGTEAGKGSRGQVPRPPPLSPLLKNFNWGAVGGFTTIDLNAGYRINQMVQLNMNITNLLNTDQIEFVGSPSIGRLIMFELKVHVPNKKGQ